MSLLDSFINIFRASPSDASVPPPAQTIAAARPVSTAPLFNGEPIPTYPDHGVAVPAAPPAALIESQRALIDRLQQASSFSHRDFQALILPAIENYAAYVHLLPASEANHHCGQGGLFRHGLEVALNAAIACETRIFAFDHWASQREKLTPRWRMCAILGGMIHDMGKPIIDVGAVDHSGDLTWNPHTGSLWDWLQRQQLQYYYIHWRTGPRHKRHEAFNAISLYRVVPPATLDWINEFGGKEPLDALVMCLSGAADPNNPLAAILKGADSRSVEHDIQESRKRLAASGHGGRRSLAARMVRAMHDSIQEGSWHINKVGSPVWVTSEGIFLQYPASITGALQILRADGDTSVPNDVNAMLDVLADWGYAHPNVLPNGQAFNTWNVRVHTMDRGRPVQLAIQAIRVAKDDIIPRAAIPPDPLKADILGPDGELLTTGTVTPATPPSTPTPEVPRAQTPPAAPGAEPPPPVAPRGSAGNDSSMSSAVLFGHGHLTEASMLLTSDDAGGDAPNLLAMDAAAGEGEPGIPPLRDRANEPDARDLAMETALVKMNRKFPPEDPAGALSWLQTQDAEGAIVIALTRRVASGELKEGVHLFDVDDFIHFRFPESFNNLGMEDTDVRTALEAKGWTLRHPQSPSRATVLLPVDGKKYTVLRFNPDLTTVIRLLLPARELVNAIAGAPKRVMPLGPELDEYVAARVDLTNSRDEDSPLVRPGFVRFLSAHASSIDRAPGDLSSDELWKAVSTFARQHRLRGKNWLLGHLKNSDNPCLSSDGAKLSYVSTYALEHDLSAQAQGAPRS